MKKLTIPFLLVALAPALALACTTDITVGPLDGDAATAADGAPLPTGTNTVPGSDGSTPGEDSGPPLPPVDAGPTTPGTYGFASIALWDALPQGEKDKVKSFRSIFMHQSVGGDMEDGAEANGFKFEYAESSGSVGGGSKQGPFGALAGSNGNPGSKTSAMTGFVDRSGTALRVAALKFGYADVVTSTLSQAQSTYSAMVTSVKAKGVRVVHVTPPFVYNVPGDNAPKMRFRQWLIDTYPSDVIFDLQDAESIDPNGGARCERGGSWEICNSVRSTSGCSSRNQGVDSPSGQGHLCFAQAQRIVKGFLYSIYQAGK